MGQSTRVSSAEDSNAGGWGGTSPPDRPAPSGKLTAPVFFRFCQAQAMPAFALDEAYRTTCGHNSTKLTLVGVLETADGAFKESPLLLDKPPTRLQKLGRESERRVLGQVRASLGSRPAGVGCGKLHRRKRMVPMAYR